MLVRDNRMLVERTGLYVGYANGLSKYDFEGNFIWGYSDSGFGVRALRADSAGNIYVGGEVYNGNTLRKYNSAGELLWSANHGDTINDIAINSDFQVVTVGGRTGNLTTRKYDSDGSLLWSVDHGDVTWGVDFDNDGNVYTAGIRTSNVTLRKYNGTGSLQWSVDTGANLGALRHADGAILVAGSTVNGFNFDRYTTAGIPFGGSWPLLHPATPLGIYADRDTNTIFVCGTTDPGGENVKKYTFLGANPLSMEYGGSWAWGVTVDSNGNIYVGGQTTGAQVRKYNSAGTEITTGFPINTGSTAYAVEAVT